MAAMLDSTDLEDRAHPTWPGTPYTLTTVVFLSFADTPCTFIHSCFCAWYAFCLQSLSHLRCLRNSCSVFQTLIKWYFLSEAFPDIIYGGTQIYFFFCALVYSAFLAIIIVVPHYILTIFHLLTNCDLLKSSPSLSTSDSVNVCWMQKRINETWKTSVDQ